MSFSVAGAKNQLLLAACFADLSPNNKIWHMAWKQTGEQTGVASAVCVLLSWNYRFPWRYNDGILTRTDPDIIPAVTAKSSRMEN